MADRSGTGAGPQRASAGTNGASAPSPVSGDGRSLRARNAAVFGAVALAWIALDFATKRFFDGSWEPGDVVAGPFLGLFRFRLVHNTGAAWGMFGDATVLLAVVSLAVCAVLTAYLFALSPRASLPETAGLALVVAGGIGNVIDRLGQGYVVDFIEPVFVDFPVFNIADIGVTCGFVLFLAALVVKERRASTASAPGGGDAGAEGEEGR